MADHLRLSPIVVCFVAGVLLTNFPGGSRDQLRLVVEKLERPIHLVLLIIVGALWHADDWRGWLLVPIFVASRLLGRWIGIRAGRRALARDGLIMMSRRNPVAMPLSVLSLAMVVNVARLYQDSRTIISWVITALLGGAIISEVLVQVMASGPARAESDQPLALPGVDDDLPEDLDEDAGDALLASTASEELDLPPGDGDGDDGDVADGDGDGVGVGDADADDDGDGDADADDDGDDGDVADDGAGNDPGPEGTR
jgi:hypothetical protein